MRNIFGSKKRFQLSLIALCLGIFLFAVSDTQAGRVTYVYDSLNRLTRAIYDKTTFTYSYDKTGNRLTKTVTLTKPHGTIDFDGDAKSDILWQHTDGTVAIWFMDGLTISPASGGFAVVPSDWQIKP